MTMVSGYIKKYKHLNYLKYCWVTDVFVAFLDYSFVYRRAALRMEEKKMTYMWNNYFLFAKEFEKG
jgi:hypothetical protein